VAPMAWHKDTLPVTARYRLSPLAMAEKTEKKEKPKAKKNPNLAFDYSKWDNIDLSDDEDTFHPNIHKDFMVRINREQRYRREAEEDELKKKYEAEGNKKKLLELERQRRINVDNMGQTVEEKTVIHSYQDGETAGQTRGFRESLEKAEVNWDVEEYSTYTQKNEALLNEFIDTDWNGARKMLMDEGGVLVTEHCKAFLLLKCLNEEMMGNRKRMLRVGERSQIITQIFTLAKSFDRPPRDFVHQFFDKMERAPEAKEYFDQETSEFCKRVQQRAVDKKKEEEEEARQAAEAAEASGDGKVYKKKLDEEDGEYESVSLVQAMYQMPKEERVGPGGLDPVEVYESLPKDMQDCFDNGDVPKLQRLSQEMPKEEFAAHFQRCIDSGLWSS